MRDHVAPEPRPLPDGDDAIERITIAGQLDRQAIEALRLEIRRLAHQHGIDVRETPGGARPA